MGTLDRRVQEHGLRTRRDFLQLGSAAVAAWNVSPLAAADADTDPQLQEAISKLEYLTPLDRAFILDKGKAGVAKLPIEKLREIGLVPETWSLEVIPDPASNSVVEQPLSRALGNALNWQGLMSLAEKHAVRFLHVMHLHQWPGPLSHESVGGRSPARSHRDDPAQGQCPPCLLSKLSPRERSAFSEFVGPEPDSGRAAGADAGHSRLQDEWPGDSRFPWRPRADGRSGSLRQQVRQVGETRPPDQRLQVQRFRRRVEQRSGEPAQDAGPIHPCAEGDSVGKTGGGDRHGAGRRIRTQARSSTASMLTRNPGRRTIPTGPKRIGGTSRSCRRRRTGAAVCREGSCLPRPRPIRPRASPSNGRCATPSSTGRCCSPACLPAATICAAAPSMAMASLSPCPARCREPVSTPSTW